MEAKVFFYGFLRELTGRSEVMVSVKEGATLQDLIDRLVEEFGEDLRENLGLERQGGSPLIMVGESDYRFAGGLEMKLKDKVPVYFIPPAAGG